MSASRRTGGHASSRFLPRRPPCSPAERAAAAAVEHRFEAAGLEAHIVHFVAPTSAHLPTLVAAAARVAAAGLVVASAPRPALALALASLLAGWLHPRNPVVKAASRMPGFGGSSSNVVAHVAGSGGSDAPPIVAAARLDTGRAGPAWRLGVIGGLAIAGLSAAMLASPRDGELRLAAAVFALEPAIAIVAVALGALRKAGSGASGLEALCLAAERLRDPHSPPPRDLWLLAAGAQASGGCGVRAFAEANRAVAATCWFVELEEPGAGDLCVVPVRLRLPRRETLPAVVRAVAGAAIESGDPIDVDPPRGGASMAATALRLRMQALTLSGRGRGPGDGTARAAEIVVSLARTPS